MHRQAFRRNISSIHTLPYLLTKYVLNTHSSESILLRIKGQVEPIPFPQGSYNVGEKQYLSLF